MDGVAVGSLYALIALGYTMVYGILKFINFAHSDIFVLGAWVSFAAAVGAGWGATGAEVAPPNWLYVVLIVIPAFGALLTGYERGVAGPLRARVRLPLADGGPGVTVLAVGVWAWAAFGVAHAARLVYHADQPMARFLSAFLILICAMLTCGLVGFSIERLAYKPLRAAPRLNVLITAIGVSLFLQNAGQLKFLFGTQPQRMPPLLPDVVLAQVMDVNVRLVDVVGAGTALVLMLLLEWLVYRTKLGTAMRAVSFNFNHAALMGISVDRTISFTFVLGTMLAAAAGYLFAMKYPGLNQPAHATWVLLGLKAFVAAVIGGIGNVRGAMLGGLFIGLIEFFGRAYLYPQLSDVYVFSLLILVLLLRPAGILGKATVEKV